MKAAYSNIRPARGVHEGGIIEVTIVPKEWISDIPVYDFKTGKVIEPLSLLPGKYFIVLTLTPESYEYDEKEKINKSGSYYEVSMSGTTNYLDASLQQVLESLRYHELVAIVTDKKRRKKLVGDKYAGMTLQISHKQTSAQGGTQSVNINLIMESEDLPPFYEP